MCLTN